MRPSRDTATHRAPRGVAAEDLHLFPVAQVPDADRPVQTRREDSPAIRCDGQVEDGAGMPWHLSHLLVRCRVPDVHNLVVSSHDKGLPVGYVRERRTTRLASAFAAPTPGSSRGFGDPRFTTAGRGRAQGTARTSGAELHNIERLQHVRRRIAELDHEADAVEDSLTAAEDCLARDRRGVLGGGNPLGGGLPSLSRHHPAAGYSATASPRDPQRVPKRGWPSAS